MTRFYREKLSVFVIVFTCLVSLNKYFTKIFFGFPYLTDFSWECNIDINIYFTWRPEPMCQEIIHPCYLMFDIVKHISLNVDVNYLHICSPLQLTYACTMSRVYVEGFVHTDHVKYAACELS